MAKQGKSASKLNMAKAFSEKNILLIMVLGFIVIMLPVLYLSFVNRATGDDYGYGKLTKMAWDGSHSLLQVFAASGQEVKEVYYRWQGTWFSVFLFTLQPEVFSERAYVITAFLMSALLLGSMAYFLHYVLCRALQLPVRSWLLVTLLFYLNSLLFVPSTRSAIYWYNGTVHYTLPFVMCLMVSVWLFCYVREYKIRHFAGILVFMGLLGGSNYQAALFALIMAVYVGGWSYFRSRNKKTFYLLIPMALETAGLMVSMKAPGNKVRGGADFGFSFAKAVETIGSSFVNGILDIKGYLLEKPMVFVIFLLIFLFLTKGWCTGNARGAKAKEGKLGWLFLPAVFCLYSAMQAPAVYAGVEVSGGVYNMNYWVFLLLMLAIFTVLSKKTASFIRNRTGKNREAICHERLVLPGIVICVFLSFMFRGNVKDSLWYVSVDYIRTGQAGDYKEQMDLQTRILMDDSIQDAVLPSINDVQGPLMHMPVTDNPKAFTNTVVKEFYGKNSVVAIDRKEWEEKNKVEK